MGWSCKKLDPCNYRLLNGFELLILFGCSTCTIFCHLIKQLVLIFIFIFLFGRWLTWARDTSQNRAQWSTKLSNSGKLVEHIFTVRPSPPDSFDCPWITDLPSLKIGASFGVRMIFDSMGFIYGGVSLSYKCTVTLVLRVISRTSGLGPNLLPYWLRLWPEPNRLKLELSLSIRSAQAWLGWHLIQAGA